MTYTINHIQQNLSISIDEKAALKMLMKLTRNQPKFGDENSFESFPPIPFITKENNLEFICYFNIFVSFVFHRRRIKKVVNKSWAKTKYFFSLI